MPSKSRFKSSRWKPGMVYAVPLLDGSYCYAQAISEAMPTVIDVAVFRTRTEHMPIEPPGLQRNDVIVLSATWRQALNRGDWAALGVTDLIVDRLDMPNQQLLDAGTTVGIKHSDSGIFESLLNAWYGLEPWNVSYNENYFDERLAPGVTRPDSAVVLSPSERELHRAQLLIKKST